jgi:hypothetical protein
MPSFTRTLVGIAPLCNANLTVIFTKHDVKAYDQAGATILEDGVTPGDPTTGIFPLSTPTTTAMRTPSSLPITNSPSFLPPTLLQNLYPRQQHQSPTPTGTASSMRSVQLEGCVCVNSTSSALSLPHQRTIESLGQCLRAPRCCC